MYSLWHTQSWAHFSVVTYILFSILCTYVYVYVYVYAYAYAYVYVYVHVFVHVYVYVNMHVHVHVNRSAISELYLSICKTFVFFKFCSDNSS